MMKLDDAYMVARMAELRSKLIDQRDRWKLQVTLSDGFTSETLDPTMVAQLRPLLVAEWDRRIAVLDADLITLGVTVGQP